MSDLDLYPRFLVALVIVLALLGLAALAVRRFGGARLTRNGRRLAVLEISAVDPKRRLLLVRRDDTEHLLLIGGPNDLVIESPIVRAELPPADRVAARRPGEPRSPVRVEPGFAQHLPPHEET